MIRFLFGCRGVGGDGMNGIPQDELSKGHRNSERIVGTIQKEGSMFLRYQEARWWVLASTFFLVVLNPLVVYPNPGEPLGFSTDLINQHVRTESQMLKPHRGILIAKRTSSSMVGTIMALLATFDEAGILPPEGTPQANQVIHGLIQLQSALMKSGSPELAAYRAEAEAYWKSQHKELETGALGEEGLTAEVLAALIAYDLEHPLWDDQKIVSAVKMFNVTRADWMLIVDLFHQADAVFREQGRSIHKVYKVWRMNLPGRKS